jgi:subtilisin family serine protease
MQFMLAPFPQGGNPFTDGDPTRSAHVLNNSWGCPQEIEGCDATSLLAAVRALRAAGIFVVASAGNDGPGCSTIKDAIAIYDEVFSVGAINEAGDLAPFSSNGPVTVDGSGRIKPDIVAPGMHVLSSFPGSTYEFEDGTSMAGPHVVGVVALLWSANPNLIGDINRTTQILRESTKPFTGTLASFAAAEASTNTNAPNPEPNVLAQLEPTSANNACLTRTNIAIVPNNVTGYGIVNAYKAVKLALGKP